MAHGPCEEQSEESVFRSRCVARIQQLDTERQKQRFTRGLVLRWHLPSKKNRTWPAPRPNNLGVGHLLGLVYRLHTLCIHLQRYCYVSIFDQELESYFGYADGLSWAPDEDELSKYGQRHQLSMGCTRQQQKTRFVEESLLPALASHTTALLDVTIGSTNVPLYSSDLNIPNAAVLSGELQPVEQHCFRSLDTCTCRYVTQPRASRPTTQLLLAPTAIHLRSGFADASATMTLRTQPSQAETSVWLRAACGNEPFADGRPRFVFSDSPGLSHFLKQRYSHVQVAPRSQHSKGTTRTWRGASREVRFGALDDIVHAGKSTQLHVAPQRKGDCMLHCTQEGEQLTWSTFYRPILQRSVCLVGVRVGIPECQNYPNVFIRDLPKHLALTHNLAAGKKPLAFQRMQRVMEPWHPCKNASIKTCYASFIAALK